MLKGPSTDGIDQGSFGTRRNCDDRERVGSRWPMVNQCWEMMRDNDGTHLKTYVHVSCMFLSLHSCIEFPEGQGSTALEDCGTPASLSRRTCKSWSLHSLESAFFGVWGSLGMFGQ